jgi:predicted nucleic acid-binding protein
MATPRRLLIIDANVLIDFALVDVSILALVAKHLGEIRVPLPLLEEVEQLDESLCEQLGLKIVDPSLELLSQAASARGKLSFEDHLCLLLAKASGLTCVTNDRALRKACVDEEVPTLWGLELMIGLVEGDHLTVEAAASVAHAISGVNPLHITAEIVAKFEERIRAISARGGPSAGES